MTYRLTGTPRRRLGLALAEWSGKRFDRRHGVETTGIVELADLDFRAESKNQGFRYEATPTTELTHVLDRLGRDIAGTTFVDYGCGKGRTVLCAALRPFGRTIGVEFSPELARIAEENAEVFRRRADAKAEIEIICGDAGDFELPDAECVLYFYNPFQHAVMERVIASIERSWRRNPRRLRVIYVNSRFGSLFDACDFLTERRISPSWFRWLRPRELPTRVWESVDSRAAR